MLALVSFIQRSGKVVSLFVCQKKITFQDGWVRAALGKMSVPCTGLEEPQVCIIKRLRD